MAQSGIDNRLRLCAIGYAVATLRGCFIFLTESFP